MQKITLVFLLCIPFLGCTQETSILKGHIVVDALQLEAINIVNRTQEIGTINDSSGYFEIRAQVGDIIEFSSIQFQSKTHIVLQADLDFGYLKVILQPLVNELEEVYISQYSLSGDLEKDLMTIPQHHQNFPLWSAKELKIMRVARPNDAQSPVENMVMGDEIRAIGAIDLSLLIDLFSGAFRNKEKEIEKGLDVTDFYEEAFFINHLNIPETEFYNFIDYLNEETGVKFMLKRGDKLKVLEFLMHHVLKFKEKYRIKE